MDWEHRALEVPVKTVQHESTVENESVSCEIGTWTLATKRRKYDTRMSSRRAGEVASVANAWNRRFKSFRINVAPDICGFLLFVVQRLSNTLPEMTGDRRDWNLAAYGQWDPAWQETSVSWQKAGKFG